MNFDEWVPKVKPPRMHIASKCTRLLKVKRKKIIPNKQRHPMLCTYTGTAVLYSKVSYLVKKNIYDNDCPNKIPWLSIIKS